MYYKLIRAMPDDKAVPGKLYRISHYWNKRTGLLTERKHYICDTMENADYLVPALIYKVSVTRSPRFKRLLPVLCQVPGRSGIRFHRGTRPEHSKGCILVSAENEKVLTELWLTAIQNHEQTYIDICHQRAGD